MKRSAHTALLVTLQVALLYQVAAWAQPERKPVADARPVLLAALQAPDGTAQGVLTGEMAEAISQQFRATSPIFIDVSTEKRYRQPGCSRLKVLLWQEDVRLSATAAPRRQSVEFGINYCLDGLPPQSLS